VNYPKEIAAEYAQAFKVDGGVAYVPKGTPGLILYCQACTLPECPVSVVVIQWKHAIVLPDQAEACVRQEDVKVEMVVPSERTVVTHSGWQELVLTAANTGWKLGAFAPQ